MLNCIATKPNERKILFQLWNGGEVGMTKHEAVEILEEVRTLDDSIFAYSQAYNDALDMAIEALKAQESKLDITDGGTKMTESCMNCACYEEKWEYCFRLGAHVPKDGHCENYHDELPKEK